MMDPLLGQMLLGRYRVVRVHGRGGMSTVYLGEQPIGGVARQVAIKALDRRATGDPKLVERFRRESETIVRLHHPNTVELYDVGELSDGSLFFVMEFVEGEPLSSVIRHGPLSSDRIDKILLQICGSVQEAHEQGVVHRDLKPANVILTNRGGQHDFVKVLDFGLAKTDWDAERLTGDDRLLGTPAYMSPEQFRNEGVDLRADIYALGMMTYQMITGRLPFKAKTPWDWATEHTATPPPPIGKWPTGEPLHPRKESAVLRALAKRPADRQASILEFLRDFTGYRDIGGAWAQATAGVGMRPRSNSLAPSGPSLSEEVRVPPAPPAPRGLLGKRSVPPPPPPPPPPRRSAPVSARPIDLSAPIGTLPPPVRKGPPAAPVPGTAAGRGGEGVGQELDLATEERNSIPLGREPGGLSGWQGSSVSLEPLGGPALRRGGYAELDLGDHAAVPSLDVAAPRSVPSPAAHRVAPKAKGSGALRRWLVAATALAIVAVLVLVGIRLVPSLLAAEPEPPVEAGGPRGALPVDDAVATDAQRAREQMRAGDLEPALLFLERSDGADPRVAAVRVELSPTAGDEVRRLVRRGRCEEAQRLYARLVALEAGASSRDAFGPRCARP